MRQTVLAKSVQEDKEAVGQCARAVGSDVCMNSVKMVFRDVVTRIRIPRNGPLRRNVKQSTAYYSHRRVGLIKAVIGMCRTKSKCQHLRNVSSGCPTLI